MAISTIIFSGKPYLDVDSSVEELALNAFASGESSNIYKEVVTKRNNGYYAIAYDKLVPVLIQAIKELKTEVHQLSNKIKENN